MLLFQAVHKHTCKTHLFVPETHLAGQLIVVFGSSPLGHRHMILKHEQEKFSGFFFFLTIHFNQT